MKRIYMLVWLLAAPALAFATEPVETQSVPDGRAEVVAPTPQDPVADVRVPAFVAPELERLPRAVEIQGLFAGGFHLVPAREIGPYGGPPVTLWRSGWWGASLWRDTVTGWPIL